MRATAGRREVDVLAANLQEGAVVPTAQRFKVATVPLAAAAIVLLLVVVAKLLLQDGEDHPSRHQFGGRFVRNGRQQEDQQHLHDDDREGEDSVPAAGVHDDDWDGDGRSNTQESSGVSPLVSPWDHDNDGIRDDIDEDDDADGMHDEDEIMTCSLDEL